MKRKSFSSPKNLLIIGAVIDHKSLKSWRVSRIDSLDCLNKDIERINNNYDKEMEWKYSWGKSSDISNDKEEEKYVNEWIGNIISSAIDNI